MWLPKFVIISLIAKALKIQKKTTVREKVLRLQNQFEFWKKKKKTQNINLNKF